MVVRKIARPLLSTFFIAGGIDALRDPAQRAVHAAPLIDKVVGTLPESVKQKIATDPETLVKINSAIQIGGGVLLASGKTPRLASLALAGTLVPTTLVGHDFWNETDTSVRAMQRTQFIKNVSLLGGLIIASVDTEGKPSLGWRGRRAAKKARASFSAALPLVTAQGHHAGSRIEHAMAVASERGSELGDNATSHGADFIELAQERGSEIAEIAGKRAVEIGEAAKERGPALVEVAQKRGSEFAETARERRDELAELTRKHSAEIAELAREKSSDWVDAVSEQTEVQGKRARKRAEAALDKVRAKKDELAH
ncbi:DoxX family protein [Rhodococcus sp. NPDC056743]|uniref:DoxX family protein n=1 Tax=Rhodococcus sp. NPDC056743 TaxID=3345934 RepID=UPI00366B46A8